MEYSRELTKELCEKICLNGDSTIRTAQQFNIPLKTLEKRITFVSTFNKKKLGYFISLIYT